MGHGYVCQPLKETVHQNDGRHKHNGPRDNTALSLYSMVLYRISQVSFENALWLLMQFIEHNCWSKTEIKSQKGINVMCELTDDYISCVCI